jgi:hypothetical protein
MVGFAMTWMFLLEEKESIVPWTQVYPISGQAYRPVFLRVKYKLTGLSPK